MRRALTWAGLSIAGLLALGMLALAALPWLLDAPRIQSYIAHAAGQALGRPVRFDSVAISAFPLPAVRIRGLSVAEDPRFGTGAFLTVADGRVGIKLRPLLLGRVELGDVVLDGLRLSLVENGGQWNLATLGAVPVARAPSRSGGAPSASGGPAGPGAGFLRVRVANGAVAFRHGGGASALGLEAVELQISPGRRADTVAITGGAETRPGAVRLRIVDAALTLPPSRQLSDATVRASIRIEAPDVRPL